MPGVFISYRREDSSGYAGRLFDILSGHFGRQNIFMDLDTIEAGDEFTAVIEEKISASDVLVAVMGTHWLTVAAKNGGRRLDDPNDFVRLEISKALKRGIRVIPVLVGGAALPREEDLPDDLRALCHRQSVEINDAHFHPDAEQLIEVLRKALHGHGFRPPNSTGKRLMLVLLSTGVVVAVFVFFLLRHPAHVATQTTSALKGSVNNRPDVAGKWNATVRYEWGGNFSEVLQFEVDGRELSGTASFLGIKRGIVDGKIDGDRVTFSTKSFATSGSDGSVTEERHHYRGTFANSDIRFTMLTDSATESHVPVHFVARK